MTGALGVFGYAGDGIAKSIDRAVHCKCLKRVLGRKWDEVESWGGRDGGDGDGDRDGVGGLVERFVARKALKG